MQDLVDEPTIMVYIANLKTVERAMTIGGEGVVRVHTVEQISFSSECDGSRQRRYRDGR